MTDPDPEAYPWLPSASVLAWLKIDEDNADKVAVAELCRKAAADWIEDQRPDLVATSTDDPPVVTFEATDRTVMAGLLSAARLFARVDSPNGVVAFAELGVGSILSSDPDVKRYLGRNKNLPVG